MTVVLPTAREGNVFRSVCHSVHGRGGRGGMMSLPDFLSGTMFLAGGWGGYDVTYCLVPCSFQGMSTLGGDDLLGGVCSQRGMGTPDTNI